MQVENSTGKCIMQMLKKKKKVEGKVQFLGINNKESFMIG